MKIDIFAHILPIKYREALEKRLPTEALQRHRLLQQGYASLTDVEARFKIMDKYEDYTQVICLAAMPFVETVADPKGALELAQIANDSLAELVYKYPERFVAAVGAIPMNDMDAALNELDRIINELHFRGIQICTNINGKPLSSPEFMPLYEKMEKYDLPILLHPARLATVPDYRTEDTSKFDINAIFGWPYETSAAMTRLVFGRVLQEYPNIKFITHHCGAMIPFFERRIASFYNIREMRGKGHFDYNRGLTKSPLEYLRMFYADTALNGCTAALMCGYTFFGADRILFGTDMPYDSQNGYLVVRETIESIEQMAIPDLEKKKIFEDNARKLFRLPV